MQNMKAKAKEPIRKAVLLFSPVKDLKGYEIEMYSWRRRLESGKERKYFIDNQTLIGLLGKKFNIYIPMKKNLLYLGLTGYLLFASAQDYKRRRQTVCKSTVM